MTWTREPGSGLAYQQVHRGGRHGIGWALFGVVCLLALLLIVAQFVIGLGFMLGYAIAGKDVSASLDALTDDSHVTPASLAFLNLGLAAAIPAAMLVTFVVHRLRPAWLASVRPRIRWRWLLVCLGLSLVTLIVTLIVSSFLPQQDGAQLGGKANPFTHESLEFLLVILFLTPLQAAGEEYAFRGYLTQAFGGVFRARWVAVVVPAVLFALAHGTQSVPVFFDRFAFGVVAGILVIATGGLEAGIAMHVLNNFLAFGAALFVGNMTDTLNADGGSWWDIPVTLVQSLVYLGLATWVARRRGVATTTDRVVLAASEPRV